MSETPKVKPWEPQERIGSLKSWLAKHQTYLKQTSDHRNDIKTVFIGDSLTENFTIDGKLLWDRHYAHTGAYNYGIYADTTSNVLWRVQNHELDGLNPKIIVFQCGYNNFFAEEQEDTAEDIAKGMNTIIKELLNKCPESKIILLSLIPLKDPELHKKGDDLNQLLKGFDNQMNVYYLDIRPNYMDGNGMQKSSLFKSDCVHLTRAGYRVWHNSMWTLYEKLLQ